MCRSRKLNRLYVTLGQFRGFTAFYPRSTVPNSLPLLHTATGLALFANAAQGHMASNHPAAPSQPQQQPALNLLAAPNSQALEQTALGEFSAHFDGVLGTSLDLVLHTLEPATALHCQEEILSEIERLRAILSTYDPASEIRQVMAGAPVRSPELAEVLAAYETWANRTGGAINVNLAHVIAAWKGAENSGVAPTTSALRAALRLPLAYNVDALGKGYIIDRAVAIARCLVPAGLLDIGGDIRVWGNTDWRLGIANPANPAENAAPVATFTLRDAAVATSGGYARQFSIAGQRHSHLISPLTLQPLRPFAAATVIASDALTANALSSAACVLGAVKGAALANIHATAHFISDAFTATVNATKIFVAAVPAPTAPSQVPPAPSSPAASAPSPGAPAAPATTDSPAAQSPWPKDFQVAVNLTLGTNQSGRGKRAYVALWIVNDKNATVRTVDVWGRQAKYWPELSFWWSDPRNRANFALPLTRATRPDGKYTLVWDGKDDKGHPLPQGKYTVVLEINREHASHSKQTVVVNCADAPVDAVLKATSENGDSPVHYGLPANPSAAKPAASAAPAATVPPGK